MTRPSKPASSVILAGAGPGDPGLFTLAADKACRSASTIFYDALVSPEILKRFPGKKCVAVGKRGGRPSPSQEAINRKLVSAATRGGIVVRLKGGDPFLFGRGGEEATALRNRGVRVRAIPGISSGMAAAAAAGFPLTDRRFASSVTFLTATAAPRGSRSVPPDYRALVRLGGTWVFFMGLQALPDIVRNLIRSGADPNLPASTISKATTRFQRVVTSTLRGLPDEALRFKLDAPALTIIGPVVSLRPPPLRDVPVLVMRPEHQAGRLSGLIRKKGGIVTEYPALKIVLLRPNPRLDRARGRLAAYDWIVLTSGNTVRILSRVLKNSSRRARLAAIGPGTAAALRKTGLRAHLVPSTDFSAEGLAETLLKKLGSPGNIWLPQAEAARDVLAADLRHAGHRVEATPIYQTRVSKKQLANVRSWIKTVDQGLVPLTSASMARAFSEAARGLDLSRLRLVSIGPVTTAAARAARLPVSAESPRAVLEDLVDTLHLVA
ncbi:uroporphyrinogen-III C-methyltransferase [bacterium]|nr:uroporphyrinogen-III C-methyltransferase [bacterium]